MATRKSVEEIIGQTTEKIEQAREQLTQANKNGFGINDDYVQAQADLAQVEHQIQSIMNSANHQQRDQLRRLHFQVSRVQNDMVLDQVDLNRYQ